MGLAVSTVKDAATNLQITVEREGAEELGVNGKNSYQRAMKKLRAMLAEGETLQKAYDAVNAQLTGELKAIRKGLAKSETDSSDAYSRDWDIGPATPDQNAALATRALQVTGLAQAADRKLQEYGGDRNNPDDVTQAINLVIQDYSGGQGETLDQMEARAAAKGWENGFVWSSDLADQRSNDDADSLNASMGVESNFSGRRNDPRAVYSPMPVETGFSGSGGAGVGAPTSDGATVTDGSIESVARAAFAAGVRVGASGVSSSTMAKNLRMRDAARGRRR